MASLALANHFLKKERHARKEKRKFVPVLN
jgi:hypothetical protein